MAVKENKWQYSLPNGYKLRRRIKYIPLDDAMNLLITKKQRKFTSVKRQDMCAELEWHRLICPFCGNETPAYVRNLSPNTGCVLKDRVPKQIIEEWGSKQLSLFGPIYSALGFNDVCVPYDYFVCAKCGHSSEPYSSSRNVSIISNGDNLILECQVLYLGETGYVHITPATRKTINIPLRERTVFNVKSGRTYIEIIDSTDETIAVEDITQSPRAFHKSLGYNILSKYRCVNRALQRAFVEKHVIFKKKKMIDTNEFPFWIFSRAQKPGDDNESVYANELWRREDIVFMNWWSTSFYEEQVINSNNEEARL